MKSLIVFLAMSAVLSNLAAQSKEAGDDKRGYTDTPSFPASPGRCTMPPGRVRAR